MAATMTDVKAGIPSATMQEDYGEKTDHYGDDLDEYDLPAKYRGTSADQRDMSVLGKKQVLRV